MSYRRENERYNVGVAANCRKDSVDWRTVQVTNVSAKGCRFICDASALAVGTRLAMTFGRVGPLEGQVKWRVENHSGVAFDEPLQPAALDHIRLFLSDKPALVAERDGFEDAA